MVEIFVVLFGISQIFAAIMHKSNDENLAKRYAIYGTRALNGKKEL